MFCNVLKRNGFVEYKQNIYKDSGEYNRLVFSDIRCYKCGTKLRDHKAKHQYHPATYIFFTGQKDDENIKETLLEEFNKKSNVYGEKIKLIVASRVMKEGRSLKNTCHEHILEAQYTVTAIQQIIGRARRHCSHIDMTQYNKPLPTVRVYMYASTFTKDKELTNDEDLYVKAIRKYKAIKIVMECLRDISFDCAIQYQRNNIIRKCASDGLNKKYWNDATQSYNAPMKRSKRMILSGDDDINYYCQKLQEFFFERSIVGKVFATLKRMEKHLKFVFDKKKSKSYDRKILLAAINRYIPKTKNELFTHKYWLYDKELNEGYLIQRVIPNLKNQKIITYIFQPYNQSEKISLEDRVSNQKMINQPSNPIESYIKLINPEEYAKCNISQQKYTFDDSYYTQKTEHSVFGTIVKDTKNVNSKWGIFKLRKGMRSNASYGRYKGVPTKEGQYYLTKSSSELQEYAKLLKLRINSKDKKQIGISILRHLVLQEQITDPSISFVQIPTNHPIIPFPLNLEDREESIKRLGKQFPNNVSILEKTKRRSIRIKVRSMNDEIQERLEQTKAKEDTKNGVFVIDLSVSDYGFS